jgi:hypothetical protein
MICKGCKKDTDILTHYSLCSRCCEKVKEVPIRISKKTKGKKLRTSMVMHRIVIKFYENGISIKPYASQGLGDKIMPKQDEIFLTNENTKYLYKYLQSWKDMNEIVETLNDNDNNEKTNKLPHITLIPQKTK